MPAFTGNGSANTMRGGDLADIIHGRDGKDKLYGDDDIDLSGLSSVSNFSQAMARATQSGNHTVFKFAEGTLIVENRSKSSFDNDDFLF
jgi:hypothetical protein